MGKVLIFKDADFSANAVDSVTPIIEYANIINPATLTNKKYINASGGISNGDTNYSVSDYIEVNGQNISAAGLSPWSYGNIAGIAVYDSGKHLLRVIMEDELRHYTYQEGDYYVRLSFVLGVINNPNAPYYIAGYPNFFACYGNTLLPYKAYGV